MSFVYSQTINPGYESNSGAVDQVNSAIDANVATTRISTSVTPGQFQITFASQPTPEEFALIAGYIATYDPYRSPVQLTPYTYDGSGIMRTDITFPGESNPTTISYLGERYNEIHISKDSQCKYSTIREALDAETANNLVFIVHPGEYQENNPLTLRSGCSLTSDGNFENTLIIANNPNENLVNLGSKGLIKGLTLQGATGAAGIYFDASQGNGAGFFSTVQECAIKNCNIGIESDGKNGIGIPDTLFCEKTKISPLSQNLSCGLYAHAKGQIVSVVLGIFGIPGYFTIADGVKSEDAGTKISISQNSIWFINRAMSVNKGGELEIVLVTAGNNNIGLEVGSTGTTSKLNASGLGIKNSTQYDLNILPSDAIVQIHSGILDDTKINNPNKLTLNAIYHLTRYGKYYQSMTGNVLLGSSREPSKLYAGEGHYDVDKVYVLSNDNLEAGNYVDNTEGALSDLAPSFALFQGTAANNCVYMGKQTAIVGFKIDVAVACSGPVTHSDLQYEYWNGSSWVSFHVQVNNSSAPYHTPSSHYLSSVGVYHVRFGLSSATPMAIKTINGKSAKWVRIRVVNPLASVPVAEMMKPHPNSTEIDADGFIKHFGDSRAVQKLPLEYSDNSAAVTPAGDQALYMSSGLKVGAVRNNYVAGVKSGVGFIVALPRNVDGSFPLKMSLSCIGSSGSAGNVVWKLRYNHCDNGMQVFRNAVDAPAESTGELVVSATQAINAADSVSVLHIKFPICEILTNPANNNQVALWVVLERDGTDPADTYTGDVSICDMSLWGITWCEGMHLLGY